MILIKRQLVSLLFSCPFSRSYTDMRNSTRTLESHCLRLLFCALVKSRGGVQVMVDLCSEGLCVQTGKLNYLSLDE